jgi:sulfonate transport system substrate-binding protein
LKGLAIDSPEYIRIFIAQYAATFPLLKTKGCKMRLSRWVGAWALFAMSMAGAGAADLPATIRFGGFGQGFGQPYGVALLAIAQSKNFIADEFKGTPVKFTYEYFTGTGPAINEAIANDRLDFAQYGSLPNIVGKAAGLPTRIVTSYGYSTVFGVVRNGVPVNTFKDLKGRKVAVAKGTVLHWAFLKALQENGLTLKDVTLVDLKTADQLAALSAGSIDAVIGTSTLLPLRDKGIAKVFYTSKDIGPQAAGFGAITVTEQFESKYPDATQRVVRGLVRAARWLGQESNREEALRIWTKSGVTYASVKEEFDGVALKDVFNPRIDDFFVGQYRDAVAFSKEEKLIRSDIDLNKWFAPQYVDRSLADLKLEQYWPKRSDKGVPIAQ